MDAQIQLMLTDKGLHALIAMLGCFLIYYTFKRDRALPFFIIMIVATVYEMRQFSTVGNTNSEAVMDLVAALFGYVIFLMIVGVARHTNRVRKRR